MIVAIVISSSLYVDVGLFSFGLNQQEKMSSGVQLQPTSLQTQSYVNGSYAGYVEWTLFLNNNTLVNGNYETNGSSLGSYPLLYAPQNGLIYVGDLITGNVSVVNLLTNKVEFNISGLGSPIGLTLDPSNNHIYSVPIPSLLRTSPASPSVCRWILVSLHLVLKLGQIQKQVSF